ncbi:hypothetical protein DSM3645_21467 [Blastopirellula marina DSM 3645]|uniref:Uncharacterized protein n=1 Tax=Blastopirellula marina DSM 3645 TaxID=314230 RepID=A3ZR87_9BACT|nr:hypothetical protein DSM3645_21467 [Blastopirellula marina DSM 3645]
MDRRKLAVALEMRAAGPIFGGAVRKLVRSQPPDTKKQSSPVQSNLSDGKTKQSGPVQPFRRKNKAVRSSPTFPTEKQSGPVQSNLSDGKAKRSGPR